LSFTNLNIIDVSSFEIESLVMSINGELSVYQNTSNQSNLIKDSLISYSLYQIYVLSKNSHTMESV